MNKLGVVVLALMLSVSVYARGGGGGHGGGGHASGHAAEGGHSFGHGEEAHTSLPVYIPHGSNAGRVCSAGVASQKDVSASVTEVTCNKPLSKGEVAFLLVFVGMCIVAIVAAVVQ